MTTPDLREELDRADKAGLDTVVWDGKTWRRRKWTGMIESIHATNGIWDRFPENPDDKR